MGKRVEQARLLHMLRVSHFHRLIIDTICVHQFLVLVHGGCLWLGEPVPIKDILIHRITQFPYKGADLAKEFGGKSKDKELTDKMKTEFRLVRKSRGYSICSITDQAV